MNHLISALALSVAALSMPAFATSHKEAPDMAKTSASAPAAKTSASAPAAKTSASAPKTAQQEKMTTCNAEATGKTGDERKAFMSKCLSAKPMTQQEKMTACNKEAAGKKGDEHKAFMSQCLSK